MNKVSTQRMSRLNARYWHCWNNMRQGLCIGTVSVRLCVHSVDRCSSVRRVCRCGPGRQEISIDSGGRSSTALSSKCEQCLVVSRRRMLEFCTRVSALRWKRPQRRKSSSVQFARCKQALALTDRNDPSAGMVVVAVVTFFNHNFVSCKATLILAIKNLRNKDYISLNDVHTKHVKG